MTESTNPINKAEAVTQFLNEDDVWFKRAPRKEIDDYEDNLCVRFYEKKI